MLYVVVMNVATSLGNDDGGYDEVEDARVDGVLTTMMVSDVFMVDALKFWFCLSDNC